MYSKGTYKFIANCCTVGILLFVIIYIVATRYYAGGSDYDRNSKGFDWLHNYWCELLATNGKSGTPNAAKPIAIGAFVILDITMMLSWLQAGFLFSKGTVGRGLVIASGFISCAVIFFLSSPSHDTVINIAGFFGLIALITTLTGLYRQKSMSAFFLGITCILLFFLNTYIYYTRHWFDALAVVQKISFVAFLWWFWLVSRAMKQNINVLIQDPLLKPAADPGPGSRS